MLIVCPSCASEYMIDPARLGAEGRTVRCASCRETFFVAPEAEAPANEMLDGDWTAADGEGAGWSEPDGDPGLEDGTEPDTEPSMTENASARAGSLRPAGGRASRLRGLAVSAGIAACILLTATALWGRQEVVRTVPAIAKLYAAVGLRVNLRGLEFRGVKSELVTEGADTLLVVEGEIANVSGHGSPVPPIEIGVRGPDGQVLYTWSNDPPQASLSASESTPFRARLAAPPDEAREVLVRFGGGGDKAAIASQGP
jgi:predicted Zn finger-like uncharacterized protein